MDEDKCTYLGIVLLLYMNDCSTVNVQGYFMYVSNLEDYGHLLNAENYETTHLHNDMFSMFDNRLVSWLACMVEYTMLVGMHSPIYRRDFA